MRNLTILIMAMALMGNYSLVNTDYSNLKVVAGMDIITADPRFGIDIVCSDDDIAQLEQSKIEFEIKIADMESFYRSRLSPESMGGYKTYNEVLGKMDSLHAMESSIVGERFSIGEGWDGNGIYAVKISDNLVMDEEEPEILIDAAIHSREVITPEIALSFMEWLTEGYEVDPVATYIVNNRELWVIPIVNPDGYIHNEEIAPYGGGMWRKNRRDNGDGTMGVDLNRNFGHMWGLDDYGSSPTSSDETYRGPSAFSEPETQGYRDFVDSRNFITNLSYHSHANLYLCPWGYTTAPTSDHDIFMEMGAQMTKYNGYPYGPGSTTIYTVNGGTFDWMYADYFGHEPIFSWSPEVGNSSDGFWPPEDRIEPLVEEHLWDCIYMCLAAGSCPMVEATQINDSTGNSSGYPDPGEIVEMSVRIRNKGLENATDIFCELTPLSGIDIVYEDMLYVGDVESFASSDYASSFRFSIDSSLALDDIASVVITTTDPDGYWFQDTVIFSVGTPLVIYQDDFEEYPDGFFPDGDWRYGMPVYGPSSAHSGERVWGTLLDSGYSDGGTISILETGSYDIPEEHEHVRLSIWHWYSTETDPTTFYDGGNVKISVDGEPFVILEPEDGYDGTLWSYNPLSGEQAFAGNSNGWKREIFDLSDYAGHTVEFRFTFASDPAVNAPGWYIDDLMIYGFLPSEISEKISLPERVDIKAYPNPFNGAVNIDYNGDSEIDILDLSGRTVAKDVGHTWRPDAEISSGLYLISTEDSRQGVLYIR